MMKIKHVFWLLNLFAGIFILTACNNPQTKNAAGANDSLDMFDESLEDMDQVIFLLPSPGDILDRFKQAKIKYNADLINSPDNKDKYLDSKSQALNLGVYITDMAYVALYNRSTETVEYLETIKFLSGEANISSNIFESLIGRSTSNAGKIDSLVNISEEAFDNMLDYLEMGGRENTIAQISAGSYIESMYIALQSVTNYTQDQEIIQALAEMKYPLDNLEEKAKNASLSEAESSIITIINEIVEIFNELDSSSSKTIVAKENTGAIKIQGGDKFYLSEADFNKLKTKITEVRNNIVK